MHSVADLGQFFTGAAMGSYMGSFVVHYWDTLATNYIMSRNNGSLNRLGRISEFAKQVLSWNHTAKTVRSYVPVAAAIVPCRAMSIAGYGYLQNLLVMHQSMDPITAKFYGAIGSGLMLSTLSAPAEQIKTMIQLGTNRSIGTQALRDSIRQYPALAMRIVPTVTCMLFLTEYLQMNVTHDIFGPSFLSMYCASIMASASSQIIATPFENLRITQVNLGNSSSLAFFDRLRQLKGEGILYKGFGMRVFGMSIQATSTLYLAYIMSSKQ